MTNSNPATPPNGVTPGSGEQNGNPPAVTPSAPATPAPGNNNVGTVTISTEEYAKLNRDAARTRSFDKRVFPKPAPQPANLDPNDPAASAIAEANGRAERAEKEAVQERVRGKVRDLLADDRFKNLPQSTKDLVLASPQYLTQAATLDEAMYDIEDKLIEMASGLPEAVPTQPNPLARDTRDTPPVVTPGTPAPVDANVLEDTTNLRGTERSAATLRNSFKEQHGGVKTS